MNEDDGQATSCIVCLERVTEGRQGSFANLFILNSVKNVKSCHNNLIYSVHS